MSMPVQYDTHFLFVIMILSSPPTKAIRHMHILGTYNNSPSRSFLTLATSPQPESAVKCGYRQAGNENRESGRNDKILPRKFYDEISNSFKVPLILPVPMTTDNSPLIKPCRKGQFSSRLLHLLLPRIC